MNGLIDNAFNLFVFSSLFMAGIIWFIQIIHYPLFKQIGRNEFVIYEQLHTKLAGILIGPVMVVELVTTLFLLWQMDFPTNMIVATVLLAMIWLSTFLVQVPLHRQLSKKFDKGTIQKLVTTNWVRTIAWTLKSLIILYL